MLRHSVPGWVIAGGRPGCPDEALAERSELSGRHARRRAAAPVAQPGGAAPRGIFPAAGPVVIDTWPGTAALDRARHVPS